MVTDPTAQGYATVAARSRMYLEMAVDLALSLREMDPARPVTLIADRRLLAAARSRFGEAFHSVVELPEAYAWGRARKFCAAELSPYAQTLFVDADSLALMPVEALWHRLSGCGFAMTGEMLEAHDTRAHHGEPVAVHCRRHGLDRYFKCNSSVFFFRREAGRRILRACFDTYRDEVHRGRSWAGDEIAFAIVGAREGIEPMPRPWPVLWPEDLPTLSLASPGVPFFTALGPPPDAVTEGLLARVGARRRAWGLPETSAGYWRLKIRSSNTGFLRARLFPLRRGLMDLRMALRPGARVTAEGRGTR